MQDQIVAECNFSPLVVCMFTTTLLTRRRAADNCCTADSADRYIKLARQMNADSLVGSICGTSFLDVVLPLFRQSELGGEEVF